MKALVFQFSMIYYNLQRYMKKQVLIELIKQNSELLKYPYYIYKNSTLLNSNVDYDFIGLYLNDIENKKTPSFLFTKEGLCFIYTKYEDYLIIIGPSIFYRINSEQEELLDEVYKYNIEYNKYIFELSNHSFYDLLNIISNINGFLNNEYIPVSQITNKEYYIYLDAINSEKDKLEENKERQSNQEYEERLLSYVSKGMVEEIEKYHKFSGTMPTLAKDNLRHYKNALIILNSLCLRKAIEGGVDQDSAYQIGELYLNKIEECKTMEDILNINANNDIPLKYAILVRNIKNDFNGSKTIKKVMEYVRNNYQKRLTVTEIADKFGLSSEYLSSLFHKEVGVTLPQYITDLKIKQAQILLKYTNLSLIDISSLLSFTSQQYFQTVFKKAVGVTPNYYRNNM